MKNNITTTTKLSNRLKELFSPEAMLRRYSTKIGDLPLYAVDPMFKTNEDGSSSCGCVMEEGEALDTAQYRSDFFMDFLNMATSRGLSEESAVLTMQGLSSNFTPLTKSFIASALDEIRGVKNAVKPPIKEEMVTMREPDMYVSSDGTILINPKLLEKTTIEELFAEGSEIANFVKETMGLTPEEFDDYIRNHPQKTQSKVA